MIAATTETIEETVIMTGEIAIMTAVIAIGETMIGVSATGEITIGGGATAMSATGAILVSATDLRQRLHPQPTTVPRRSAANASRRRESSWR